MTEHFRELTPQLGWVRRVEVGVAEVLDLLGQVAEEVDVVFADLAGDFDVGAVAGADDEAAVHDEFHAGGAAGFGAGGRDVFGDVGGGDYEFAFGDVVVFDEAVSVVSGRVVAIIRLKGLTLLSSGRRFRGRC